MNNWEHTEYNGNDNNTILFVFKNLLIFCFNTSHIKHIKWNFNNGIQYSLLFIKGSHFKFEILKAFFFSLLPSLDICIMQTVNSHMYYELAESVGSREHLIDREI